MLVITRYLPDKLKHNIQKVGDTKFRKKELEKVNFMFRPLHLIYFEMMNIINLITFLEYY